MSYARNMRDRMKAVYAIHFQAEQAHQIWYDFLHNKLPSAIVKNKTIWK